MTLVCASFIYSSALIHQSLSHYYALLPSTALPGMKAVALLRPAAKVLQSSAQDAPVRHHRDAPLFPLQQKL